MKKAMMAAAGLCVLLGAGCAVAASEGNPAQVPAASSEAELAAKLPGIFARAAEHYRALDVSATPLMEGGKKGRRTPHGFDRAKCRLDMRSIFGWTSGHFPGSLWYLYEATGDDFFRDRATVWTETLAPNAKVTNNHDVGFIMYCSYGNARRLLKTDKYDELLLETAESLSSRFNEKLGLVRSWGKADERRNFLVIPDNMMNLELLEAASSIGGVKRFAEIAESHADVTMRNHFDAEGGCHHVLNYDQETGRIVEIRPGQGASCTTAWSRGQSWAIYGYTMMYRMTGFARYLAFARKLADYAIGHPNMPADGVPYWDYGRPGEERDSSAAAIMASGLLELSQAVDAEARAHYRGFAVKQLLALASDAYFSTGDEIGHFLLKHGVGHKPGKSEIDTPLAYGDYYFLEALLRFRALVAHEARLGEIREKLPARATLSAASLKLCLGQDDAQARALADAALTEPVPDTSDELYGEFWETGNRSHYEHPYSRRSCLLGALTAVEAEEKRGRYLPKIADYLKAICAMKSWTLPAHDHADGGRGNFRGTCLTVELGNSGLAATLGCVIRLVGDRLDPALVRRVCAETERRVFAPLRRELPLRPKLSGETGLVSPHRYHWWADSDSNWSAVCWGNVVCAALALLDDPNDRAYFVDLAIKSIPRYLSGFTPDGYCSEGMGYWNYGYGHHLQMGLLLRQETGGRIDIFTAPKQRTVAAYPRAYTLCEGISPAFADGNGPVQKRLLGFVDEIWPDLPKELPPVSEFPDGQVWLFRDPEGLSVAFKGGHNAELHNHNDIGSYYVVCHGKFLSGDPGGEQYTRFTFSKQRYEAKVLNSYGHPVPVVGGVLQSTGRRFAAKVVSKDLSSPQATVVLDLTDAYEVRSLKSLTRTFVYDRAAKRFTVTDRVLFDEPTAFESAYNTFLEPDNAGRAGQIAWNVRPKVTVRGGAYETVEEDIANPNRISPHRVGIRLKAPVTSAEVSFAFGPNPAN